MGATDAHCFPHSASKGPQQTELIPPTSAPHLPSCSMSHFMQHVLTIVWQESTDDKEKEKKVIYGINGISQNSSKKQPVYPAMESDHCKGPCTTYTQHLLTCIFITKHTKTSTPTKVPDIS